MIVLLRGINVSGRNRVPMAELRSALSDAGFANAATYIQSGNIAVDTRLEPDELCSAIELLVSETFNVDVPAVAIAQSDIAAVEAAAPFAPDADPSYSLIYFSRDSVDVEGINNMDPTGHPNDEVTATSSAVYVFYGQGQSKSKLSVDKLERAAGTTLTGRNLRSVSKLQSL